MAFIPEKSFDEKYWANVECLDDDTALRAFHDLKSTMGMKAGIAVPSKIVPRRYVVTDEKVPVHGFFSCVNGTAVDDRMVSAVEALEPGVHRFHPVEIMMKATGEPCRARNSC